LRSRQIELPVSVRTEVGKAAAGRLRRSGLIPAVIYGRGIQSQPLSVEAAAFARAIPENAWYSTVIRLRVQGDSGESLPTVMITEVQRDLTRGRVLSIDFHRISLQEAVRAHVPVVPVGHSAGVRLGGILEQIVHEVEVECLPTSLPDHLEVEVSELMIGDVVRVRDLKLPPGVRLMTAADEAVLLVAPPARAEEAAPAPAAAEAVVAETEEPQVIGQREAEKKQEG
jgi:large subunit ribosomal protein L25